MNRLLSIQASAGSGKTFSLSNRYLSLLFQGVRASEIVAITFTKKAASEMEERIVKYLKTLETEDDFLNELSLNSGIGIDNLLKKRKKILDEFLKSDIHITTIDSFIQKIARKFAPYGGIDVDFDIKKDNLDDIFGYFINDLNEKDFNTLIEFAKQENLIYFFESLYLIDKEINRLKIENKKLNIANSKSKIETLQNKLLYLVENCSDSTKKFISQDVEKTIFSDRIKTILQNNTLKYNRSIFNKCYSEQLDDLFFEFYNESFIYLHNKYLSKELYILKTIFDFYNYYKNKKLLVKKEKNYLDFKDIEHLVYKILVEDSLNKDFLYFRLDSKINHILIDEFQDTSITQWNILSPIIDEIASGLGQHTKNRTFYYVGDTKQAIYRFRGGNSELFEYVYNKYKNNGMKQLKLSKNYRSGKEIVEFVNDVFDLDEIGIKDGGYVEIIKNSIDENSSKQSPKFNWRDNLKDILTLFFEKGVKDSDIAILVYKNNDILEVADFIKSTFNKTAITSTTKQIINQPFAKAVIDLMKYLYYKDKGELFLFNFLTFIDKEFDINFSFDIELNRPSVMIKNILDKYNLWDKSTLKLLEYSLKYDTLIDFVFDIDNCEEKLNTEVEGINILTIHKSKGLEFENVIVIDKMTKDRNGGIKLLYDYDEIELKNIRYIQKNMEILDEDYKRVLQKDKLLEEKDLTNVEYVAFTRAKNSLFILQNEKNSNFLSLDEYQGEIKRGDFRVRESEIKEIKKDKFDLELRFYGHQDFNGEKNKKIDDYEAIYRGLAIHSLFEMNSLDFVRNRYGIFVDIDEISKIYQLANKYEEFTNKLRGKVYKELPFSYKNRVGIIDLMIEYDDKIIIIDYKSKKPEDESEYKNQVRFYKDSIKNIKQKNVYGFLFYIEELILEEVF